MRFTMIAVVLAELAALGMAAKAAAANTGKPRQPQFPLKTARMLLTNAQIEQAKRNIETYPAAKAVASGIIRAASAWADWPDQALRDLLPSADVPRAFNVSTKGCPVCGDKIYEGRGFYPWIVDPKKPFKIECPVCGGIFPDNDFAAYYRSGFEDKSALKGKYSDDGWGWVGPDGERYWLVGYANHWMWENHIIPALGDLSRAYVLTGDRRFAHQAAVMLDRIAEVYPAMDYHNQSRYGQLQEARGHHYGGKIVNSIWETGVLRTMAEAYDNVWETINDDAALQALTGRTGEQIRAHIEANILEEGVDAYFAEEVRGNFGMHQRALVFTALARQHGATDEWLDGLFTRADAGRSHIGLNYALYNLVYRDGPPYETAPGYNFSWVRNLTDIAEALKLAGRDLYASPKMHWLYDGVLDIVNCGQFTSAVGDSGNVWGGKVGEDAVVYQAAYRAYRDPRYLRHLAGFKATGDACFTSYESLFLPPLDTSDAPLFPQPSRLLDGYGMGILNNPADSISASLYYGLHGGHGHMDRMHFDVFANGQPMMPDLGYPDFMNAYVPGIFTWSKNTICHNTVTVDTSKQPVNQAGTVQLFAGCPFARVLDVDAPETYPQCTTYRRQLLMVDIDDAHSYFLDVFTVEGGSEHDYALHGPPGEFEAIGGDWEAQAKGTLAGEDVALAQIYDDPVLGAEGYDGGYGDYQGSGFQHFMNVRRHRGGSWVGEWRHEKDPDAKLRIRLLEQPGQEIILANAQVSPVRQRELLTYLIARRTGKTLCSRFVSVIEPFAGAPVIEAAEFVPLDKGHGICVAVRRLDGAVDVIMYDPSQSRKHVRTFGIKTAAQAAVVRIDAEGQPAGAFFAGGESMHVQGKRLEAEPLPSGVVSSVEPDKQLVHVKMKAHGASFDPASLVGRVAHFKNDIRKTAHPVAAASLEGDELLLTTGDALLVGRARLKGVAATALETDTAFMFAPVYRGTYAADLALTTAWPITEVEDGAIHLAAPLPEGHAFAAGDDVWIVNVGAGDQLDITPTGVWKRETPG